MSRRIYYHIASILFSTVAIIHFVRAFQGWDLTVSGYAIPTWVSWIVFVLTAYLAIRGFSFIYKNY